MVRLDLDRIRRARTAIDPVFLDTPQYECPALGDVLGCSITLKIETLNPVRSFKGRGTETALSWLAQREEVPTAVCASAGNLGQALAYSGARRGIPVTVVAARTANPFKIERITALGATVQLAGDDIEDARLLARTIAEDEGAHLVEDSLDLSTCEGAGLGVATVLENRERFAGRRVATIICGSNVTTSDYERWVLSPD
jgi:threonine dehydratase